MSSPARGSSPARKSSPARGSSPARKASRKASGKASGGALGKLTVLATPIGNLGDLSFRGVEALGEAEVLAAEDTRRVRQLLAGHGLRTPATLFSYRAENEFRAARRILSHLEAGRGVVLVSDAGMPLVSDPGREAVALAVSCGIEVEVLPGASAVTMAVAVAGFGGKGFVFLGFAAHRGSRVRRAFGGVLEFDGPVVIFEHPRRLARTLRLGAEVFGARRGVVCFEMSKRFERHWRGDLLELAERVEGGSDESLRGEATLVIAGCGEGEGEGED
ncbi:MAG: rRNA small subunit methyltransferase 1 [Alphaproteobacteria bacterium]